MPWKMNRPLAGIPDMRNTLSRGKNINDHGMFQKQVAQCVWNAGYRRRNDLQSYRGYKAGDVRDAGRSPGGGNGNPL